MLTGYETSVERRNSIAVVMLLFADFKFETALKKCNIINLKLSTHIF
jgi:hypothetical protein